MKLESTEDVRGHFAAAWFNYGTLPTTNNGYWAYPLPKTKQEKAKIDPNNEGFIRNNIVGPHYIVPTDELP